MYHGDPHMSGDNIRKRVCKACDRCRLKKSKCDGASPCSRCKTDNAICVFGERKKSQDKIYPKGYVEMLEQQQSQLVNGLRELYRRTINGQQWTGPHLTIQQCGHPLTHDILEALNLLHVNDDGDEPERFEEDTNKMQEKLLEKGATYTRLHRGGSPDSNEDQTQASTSSPPPKPIPSSNQGSNPPMWFNGNCHPLTPPSTDSVFPRQSQLATLTPPSTDNAFRTQPPLTRPMVHHQPGMGMQSQIPSPMTFNMNNLDMPELMDFGDQDNFSAAQMFTTTASFPNYAPEAAWPQPEFEQPYQFVDMSQVSLTTANP